MLSLLLALSNPAPAPVTEASRPQTAVGYSTGAECVCSRFPNWDGFHYEEPSPREEVPTVEDFAECPRAWPGYPDLPPPRMTQELLDTILARGRCEETLYAADARWRYGINHTDQTKGCGSSGGSITARTAGPFAWLLGLLALARPARRQRSARPKSARPSID